MSNINQENLVTRIEALEIEINIIKKRNQLVQADKAWETSKMRISFIVGMTYMITSAVFWIISIPNPLLNAFIPTTGYFLSTLSLPLVKRYWSHKRPGINSFYSQ